MGLNIKNAETHRLAVPLNLSLFVEG